MVGYGTMRLVVLISFVFVAFAFPQGGEPGSGTGKKATYANELPDYKIYDTGPWSRLTPRTSRIEEVRKILGSPDDAKDLADYFSPYPGDSAAKQPVLSYTKLSERWDLLSYFGRYCYSESKPMPEVYAGRLCSVNFLPKKRLAFSEVAFPNVFAKEHKVAVDAAWDEYGDTEGLVYQVYTTKTPYGDQQPGDLNRIVYGVPLNIVKSPIRFNPPTQTHRIPASR
jgi:hypothetical protein